MVDEDEQRNRWARTHKARRARKKERKRVRAHGPFPASAKASSSRAPGVGKFRADLERFLHPKEPVALARFHDGECHMLQGEPYNARSGWRLYRPSWMQDRLVASLEADMEGYWVGISPPCDWPEGTAVFRPHVATVRRMTFATIFWHSNYAPFMAAIKGGSLKDACIVTSGKGDYKVPKNGAVEPWDLDGLVDELLQEQRTILVAAGPCACVIVHEYWKRADPQKRQTILDVGAAIDPIVHGRNTRDFHDPSSPLRQHVCSFQTSVPWAKKKAKKPKGWRGYLARKGPNHKPEKS